MTTRTRVGIVGATVTVGGSGWGANAHVPALHALADSYELKAVCTAHADTAQASAAAFGADLAFDRFGDMLASPEIDLVVVSVRVPGHYDLVMQALQAGKAVFCEWPLGANLAEAEQMAALAAQRSPRTAVGLQARSDPTLTYVRELVLQGHIGEVLSATLSYVTPAITQRGAGRIWQGDRRNGANTLTIAGGHAIDALCFVLGEFSQVTARLATLFPRWHNTDTGQDVVVDAPDYVSLTGRLASGAEVACLVATVASNPSGIRFEIYGSQGALVISGSSLSSGASSLQGSTGSEPLVPMETPARFSLVPASTPPGPPRNVAQAYVRLADAAAHNTAFQPDLAHAVRRHQLIDAIERSAAEGRTVQLSA